MNWATALPSTNATEWGIDWRLKELTSSGFVSEFTFTSRKRPPYSRSSRSRSGPSALHGPHQGAQKSTSTGTSMEASITSRSKDDSVASIIAFSLSDDRCAGPDRVRADRAGNAVRRAQPPPQDSSYRGIG